MKTISIRFRCGHFEKLTLAEIKKQKVEICPVFKVNGQNKAESGQYCCNCSPKKVFPACHHSKYILRGSGYECFDCGEPMK